jgi:hypothetical protein
MAPTALAWGLLGSPDGWPSWQPDRPLAAATLPLPLRPPPLKTRTALA